MGLDSRLKRLGIASALVGVLALAAASGGAAAPQGSSSATIPNCVPAQNIEGIIDDSGSMNANDPNNYRADLLEALAFFNQQKTMGAVIFGSSASALFGPFLVGPNFNAIKSALDLVQSTSGGTNYDAAFSLANQHNPNANARIFLSDGEPGGTPNSNLWKTPRIPAYVVGFGTADFTILNQIAVETGGPSPFSIINSSQLRTVGQIINARINCLTDPILAERQLARQGQQRGVGFKPDGNSAQVLISWPTEGNVIKALAFTQGGGGGKSALASIARKKKKVKVQSQRGTTYVALNLRKLKKGKKVKFKLKAKRLVGPETVTAAIIP